MDDLLKTGQKNFGGMLRFAFMIHSEIAVFPVAEDKVLNDPIQMSPGKRIYSGYCTQGLNGFKEECIKDGNEVKYKISFTGHVPEMGAERSLTIEDLNLLRFVVIAIDNTKKKPVIGTPTNPCRCVADFDTSTTFVGKKGHTVTFYWESIVKCDFYDVPVAYDPGPGGGS